MQKIIALLLCVFPLTSYCPWYIDSDGRMHEIKEAKVTISKQSIKALERLNNLSKKLISGKDALCFEDICAAIRQGNQTVIGAWLFAGGEPDAISMYSNEYCKAIGDSILLSTIKSGNKACVIILLNAGAQLKKYYNEPIELALQISKRSCTNNAVTTSSWSIAECFSFILS